MPLTKSVEMIIQERDDCKAEAEYWKNKAEGLRERVVWKGVGTVVHFKAWAKKPPVSWVEFGSALDSDLDVLPLPPGTGTDGERVRITVTKEE